MLPATTDDRRLTYDDLLAMPEDRLRHELIDGVHYVTPSPASPHQVVLGNLYFRMRQHLETHAVGTAYLSPLDVVFTMFDVVEPDLLFISTERERIVTHRNVSGAPDLVVEILSKTTARRDEGVKLELYSRHDVREYWVLDPKAQAIRVYRRRRNKLAVAEELKGADAALASPLLPGMSLPLAKIFEGSGA